MFGKVYYQPLINFTSQHGTIAKNDIKLLLLTDDFNDAMQCVITYLNTNFKVMPHKPL